MTTTTMETLRPIRDLVLVRVLPGEDQTKGGIIIPEISRGHRQSVCEVLATGRGYYQEATGTWRPCVVKKGDRVATRWNPGTGLDRSENLRVVREGEIMGIIE